MRMAEQAFSEDQKLSAIADYVDDTGRRAAGPSNGNRKRHSVLGNYTISCSCASAHGKKAHFRQKVLAALRLKFGGHAVKPAGD